MIVFYNHLMVMSKFRLLEGRGGEKFWASELENFRDGYKFHINVQMINQI